MFKMLMFKLLYYIILSLNERTKFYISLTKLLLFNIIGIIMKGCEKESNIRESSQRRQQLLRVAGTD